MTNIVTHLELIEGSKSQRDKFISKVEVLERVKEIAFLPYEETMTTEMVANFYEVSEQTIKSLVFDHKDELLSDGYNVLEKESLSSFKKLCQIQSRARNLAIFPKRAVLRVGMLLRDSPVAIQVRNYLLDIESKASDDVKLEVIESYFDKLKSEFNSQNDKLIKFIKDDNLYIIERIDNSEQEIIKSRKELTEEINNVHERLSKIENSLIFKQYQKPTHRFEASLTKYAIHYDYSGSQRYFYFYKDLENWLEITLPRNKKYTTKEYILSTCGIDTIEMFIDGIISGRIIKSDKDNYVDLNGVFNNPVEWAKIKHNFNNKCAYCGDSDTSLVEEHLVAQSKENSNDLISNIVCACQSCNKSKNTEKMTEWYTKQSFYSKERYDKIVKHYRKYNITNTIK